MSTKLCWKNSCKCWSEIRIQSMTIPGWSAVIWITCKALALQMCGKEPSDLAGFILSCSKEVTRGSLRTILSYAKRFHEFLRGTGRLDIPFEGRMQHNMINRIKAFRFPSHHYPWIDCAPWNSRIRYDGSSHPTFELPLKQTVFILNIGFLLH